MRLIPNGKKVRLIDLEPGTLFLLDDCLAVKSEYLLDSGKIEAIIVGSGEFFHGAKTVEEQYNLMVQPLEIEDHYADDDLISRDYVMNEILSLHGVGGMYVYDPTEVHNIIDKAPSVYGGMKDNG